VLGVGLDREERRGRKSEVSMEKRNRERESEGREEE
jgi:hypothetical protein